MINYLETRSRAIIATGLMKTRNGIIDVGQILDRTKDSPWSDRPPFFIRIDHLTDTLWTAAHNIDNDAAMAEVMARAERISAKKKSEVTT